MLRLCVKILSLVFSLNLYSQIDWDHTLSMDEIEHKLQEIKLVSADLTHDRYLNLRE